mmetsp:Transcript_4549/g.9179  ORF Transcript_4549/g.9179 Transcript_4549/m.9179 type:complete len:353 (+) Transcript_4549:63-1121(+)
MGAWRLSSLLTPGRVEAEDGNELVDLVLLLLEDAFRNPDQVTDFLFLEFDISVEAPKVELTFKCKLKHLNVTLVKSIVNGLVSSARVHIPESSVLREQRQHASKLFFILHIHKHGSSNGVQMTNCWVKTLAVRLAHGRLVEGRSKRVESDVNSVCVSADLKDISHNSRRVTSKAIYKLSKILQPVLDQGRLNDLDFHLLQNIASVSAAVLQEQCKVGTNGGIDKHGLVKISVSLGRIFKGGDTTHGAFLEHTKRVALLDQFIDITATEGSLQEKHDVFDHVLIRDKIKEGRERSNSLSTQVFKFGNKLFNSSLLHQRRRQRRSIGNSVTVIRLGKIQAHIVKRFALRQVVVI